MDKNSYSRISENVLFAVLVATVIGWTAASVAGNPLSAPTPAAAVVTATTASANS